MLFTTNKRAIFSQISIFINDGTLFNKIKRNAFLHNVDQHTSADLLFVLKLLFILITLKTKKTLITSPFLIADNLSLSI